MTHHPTKDQLQIVEQFNEVLNSLSRIIRPNLIDQDCWKNIFRTVRNLPIGTGTGFGFELPLGETTARSDFYVSILRPGSLTNHLIARGYQTDANPISKALANSLNSIEQDAPWADTIGLEFDIDNNSDETSAGFFARFDHHSTEIDKLSIPNSRTAAEWICKSVGWIVTPSEIESIDLAFKSLTDAGVCAGAIGIMPMRPIRTIIINTCAFEPNKLSEVLHHLEWSGPSDQVIKLVNSIKEKIKFVRLDIGVRETRLSSRLGIELFQQPPGILPGSGIGGWQPVLAQLCNNGLCLPEKYDALLAWPTKDQLFGKFGIYALLSSVVHMKLVFEPQKHELKVQAKAYPATGYLFLEEFLNYDNL